MKGDAAKATRYALSMQSSYRERKIPDDPKAAVQAAKDGDKKTLQDMLRKRYVRVDKPIECEQNKFVVNFVIIAALNGHADTVQMLLDEGQVRTTCYSRLTSHYLRLVRTTCCSRPTTSTY